MAGLRLRLAAIGERMGRLRGPPGGHQADARAGSSDVREDATHRVRDANVPKGIPGHIPIIVGGNGLSADRRSARSSTGDGAELRVPDACRDTGCASTRHAPNARADRARPRLAALLAVHPRRGHAARPRAQSTRCGTLARDGSCDPDRAASPAAAIRRPVRGRPPRFAEATRRADRPPLSDATRPRAARLQGRPGSDVVCPWCCIGKRRFEAALARFEAADTVEITWRSFQLNPDYPVGAHETHDAYLAHKLGVTPAQVAAAQRAGRGARRGRGAWTTTSRRTSR